jgi:hypothetical protein
MHRLFSVPSTNLPAPCFMVVDPLSPDQSAPAFITTMANLVLSLLHNLEVPCTHHCCESILLISSMGYGKTGIFLVMVVEKRENDVHTWSVESRVPNFHPAAVKSRTCPSKSDMSYEHAQLVPDTLHTMRKYPTGRRQKKGAPYKKHKTYLHTDHLPLHKLVFANLYVLWYAAVVCSHTQVHRERILIVRVTVFTV